MLFLDDLDRPSARRAAGRRMLALTATAAAAATGFGLLAAASARRTTAHVDHKVRRKTKVRPDHAARQGAEAIAPAGKWFWYVPAALALSTYLLAARDPAPWYARRGPRVRARHRRAGAGAVAAAAIAAALLNKRLDDWLPQPPAPPGRADRNKPVFPSGHAMGPGSVALASAWVLAREGLLPAAVGAPAAAALPLVTAAGKMMGQKHWLSDLVGGYLGATTLAAVCVAGYEAVREKG